MYKLPCPNNVLYLELVGKEPPLGAQTKVVSVRPATGTRYIRRTGTMSTSKLFCYVISVTAEAPYLRISTKNISITKLLPLAALFFFFFQTQVSVNNLRFPFNLNITFKCPHSNHHHKSLMKA